MTQLPAILTDLSGVVFNAVLERRRNSSLLALSVFFLGHKAFHYMPQAPILMINASSLSLWSRVASSLAQRSVPEKNGLQCFFTETPGKVAGYSDCFFLPSSTSADTGLNRNLEVCHCDLPWSWTAGEIAEFRNYRKKGVIRVELQRKNASVLNFEVNLRKRQANGYGLGLSRRTSAFDPWNKERQRNVFLVASAIRPLEPTRPDVSIGMLLEFVSHNVRLGFHHQFLGVFLDARSSEFERTVAALSRFIKAGLVSLTPLSMRGVDDVSGVLGLAFIDDYTRYVHMNQVLALSRGMASHLVCLGASEFLVLGDRFPFIGQLLYSFPPLVYPKVYYKVKTFGVADPPGTSGKGPSEGESVSSYYRQGKPFGPLPAFNVAVIPVQLCWLVSWHEAAACGTSSFEMDRPVRPDDAVFIEQRDAQVYFFRQSNFDTWQLKREHYPPEANNYTQRYGKNLQNALVEKTSAVAPPPTPPNFPRGQQWLRTNGFIECKQSEGCSKFSELFSI